MGSDKKIQNGDKSESNKTKKSIGIKTTEIKNGTRRITDSVTVKKKS